MILVSEMFLEVEVLQMGGFGLLLQELVFNGSELVRKLWLAPAPFAEVCCHVLGLLSERP